MSSGFIFNYIFAWIAVLLGVILLSKYLLRKFVQGTNGNKRAWLSTLNRTWKWPHIILGFMLIVIGLVHGLHSSVEVFSFNFGTLNWLVTMLFGLTWIYKNQLQKRWMQVHRFLALLFMLTIVVHIIDVGGINIFRIISEMDNQDTYVAVLEDLPSPQENNASGNTSNDKADNNDNLSNKDNASNYDNAGNTETLPFYFSFDDLELQDGKYIAQEVGYSPGLKLEVTIKDNVVRGIRIISHNELDSNYYREAMIKVPAAILEQQTLDVDMITGSSFTSVGIIRAVRKAVLEAAENKLEEQAK